MTDEEVLAELRSDTPLNRARRQFSSWSARIEQASQQRKPIGPIEMRRMEFEVVPANTERYLRTPAVSTWVGG
jgi:hypothetical protein